MAGKRTSASEAEPPVKATKASSKAVTATEGATSARSKSKTAGTVKGTGKTTQKVAVKPATKGGATRSSTKTTAKAAKTPAGAAARVTTAVLDRTVTIPPHVDEGLARSWHGFKSTGDTDARERLILHYAPLVKYVASRVATGLPSSVEQADLVSYGMFGLIDALQKFEPGRGNKFETYAIPRIRGAIIDELRAMDWVPRSVRFKAARDREGGRRPRGDAEAAPDGEGAGGAARDVARASCTTSSRRSRSCPCWPSTKRSPWARIAASRSP